MREDRPSATAYLIARSTLAVARHPVLGQFVPRHSAELSERFVGAGSRCARLMSAVGGSSLARPLAGMLERLTVPGIKLHYALRKRFLEEVARAALGDGLRQVVVLGAGFDTLALRLRDGSPETKFFEVDHPATQRAKIRALGGDEAAGRNLRFIPLDFARGSLEGALLSRADYDREADTLFVAEGLLMYLALAEVDLVLNFVRRHSGRASRLAFTFMETQAGGRIGFRRSSRLVSAWLCLRRESFRWGLPRAQAREFLAARGLAVRELISSETLRARYLTAEGLGHQRLADGECICVCEPS
ncbi:MAG TPA: SAM-dependent methyltransferase [Pyrinomonadaceae bacterium]|nr:SAM-dependent methyltransferase [Pyrinomonadaceae bacterium]